MARVTASADDDREDMSLEVHVMAVGAAMTGGSTGKRRPFGTMDQRPSSECPEYFSKLTRRRALARVTCAACLPMKPTSLCAVKREYAGTAMTRSSRSSMYGTPRSTSRVASDGQ